MELLKRYFELEKEIHAYFGYQEDWRVIPLADKTDHYWFVNQDSDGSGVVVHSPGPLTPESIEAGDKIYSGDIYTQRHLPKWVYRAADYTMVVVDTRTDGNKFLTVFDNKKECRDPELVALYHECW